MLGFFSFFLFHRKRNTRFLYHIPKRVHLPEDCFYTCPLAGVPLLLRGDRPAQEGRAACVPGSRETTAMSTNALGSLPTPGPCVDNILEQTPSLSETEAYLPVLELWP